MPNVAREVKFWIIAVILVLAGIGLPELVGQHWKSTAEALIIAGVLAMTVDRYVKLRLREEIAHDVFYAALGVHLPQEIKDEMLAIGDCKLVRRNFDVTYKLTPHHNPMLINCEVQTAFSMHNLTDHSHVYTCEIAVSDAPAGGENAPVPVSYVKAQRPNGQVPYEYVGEKVKLDESDHGRIWREQVKIPARDSVRFWATSHQVLPAEYEEPFIFAQPTIGVTVKVDAPPEVEHAVIFDHRLGGDAEELPHDTWKLNAAFFANTLFRVVWKRTDVVGKVLDLGPKLRITPTAHETVRRPYANKAG